VEHTFLSVPKQHKRPSKGSHAEKAEYRARSELVGFDRRKGKEANFFGEKKRKPGVTELITGEPIKW